MSDNTPRITRARHQVALASILRIAFVAMVSTTWTGCRAAADLQSERIHGTATGVAQRSVLILTGEDYSGHDWRRTAAELRRQLAVDTRLAVDVVTDLSRLPALDLEPYSAVVLHFKNYDARVPGRAGFERLAGFVRSGGGLVLVHFACGAFQEFKGEFEELSGRVWNPRLRGHDRHGRFRVEVLKTGHPVTRGVASFETTDELYTCLDGTAPVTVLAEATSRHDGRRYPMAFVLRYGAGRVFHCPLGHDVPALAAPAVGALFRAGCAWVCGLRPAPESSSSRTSTTDQSEEDAP